MLLPSRGWVATRPSRSVSGRSGHRGTRRAMASERRLLDNSRVLVTGGSGFIGTNLIESLRRRAASVLNLDVVEPRNGGHIDVWKRCDICDERRLSDVVASYRPEIVVHLGAR